MSFVKVPFLLALFIGDPASEPAITGRFGHVGDQVPFNSLRAVAIDAKGDLVAFAGEPETPGDDFGVHVCRAKTGEIHRLLRGHEASVRSVAFSPRGDRLATLTSDNNGVGILRIFDTKTGERLVAVESLGKFVRFLPSGEVAIGGFGPVVRIDSASGDESARFEAMPIAKDLSADGRFALGVSHYGQNVLEVRDLADEKRVIQLEGSTGEPLVALFSPNSRVVAASDPRSRAVIVWEVLTGEVIHRFRTDGFVAALAFTSDGRHLLGGGSDRSIRAWEIASGESTGRLWGHEGLVTALAIGPRESLLSGSADRTAFLWSLDSLRTTRLAEEQLHEARIDDIWRSLGESGATDAYRALGVLAANSDELLPNLLDRLERQLRPVPDADLARLLVELSHDDYRVREQATASLAQADDSIRPQLEYALEHSTSAEARARLRLILHRSSATPRFGPEDIRRLRRLVAAAEGHPGEAAQRLLEVITKEFPEPSVAEDARRAMKQR